MLRVFKDRLVRCGVAGAAEVATDDGLDEGALEAALTALRAAAGIHFGRYGAVVELPPPAGEEWREQLDAPETSRTWWVDTADILAAYLAGATPSARRETLREHGVPFLSCVVLDKHLAELELDFAGRYTAWGDAADPAYTFSLAELKTTLVSGACRYAHRLPAGTASLVRRAPALK